MNNHAWLTQLYSNMLRDIDSPHFTTMQILPDA